MSCISSAACVHRSPLQHVSCTSTLPYRERALLIHLLWLTERMPYYYMCRIHVLWHTEKEPCIPRESIITIHLLESRYIYSEPYYMCLMPRALLLHVYSGIPRKSLITCVVCLSSGILPLRSQNRSPHTATGLLSLLPYKKFGREKRFGAWATLRRSPRDQPSSRCMCSKVYT